MIPTNNKKYSNEHPKGKKPTQDTDAMVKYEPGIIKTTDGYTFYRQSDGSYTDTKDGKNRDLKFNSLKDINKALKEGFIGIKKQK